MTMIALRLENSLRLEVYNLLPPQDIGVKSDSCFHESVATDGPDIASPHKHVLSELINDNS